MRRRVAISDLPFWPRLLSREEAARYVGVSPAVFDEEVKQGVWPPALRRGGRGGRQTWDRLALDRAADQASGLAEAPPAAARDVERADAKAALMAAVEGYTGNRRR